VCCPNLNVAPPSWRLNAGWKPALHLKLGQHRELTRRVKDFMKTLTITEAKKNLSRWLDAAASGQDIGIIRGAEIIALRRVEGESTDYAQREYAATPEQIAAFADATEKRYRRLKRSGKLVTVTTEQLRNMLE